MGFISRWLARLKPPPLDLEARIGCFREVLHANKVLSGLQAIELTLPPVGVVRRVSIPVDE